MRCRLRPSVIAAVLAVVLAGLVHVLACAHGPVLGGDTGADSLPGVSVASVSSTPTSAITSTSRTSPAAGATRHRLAPAPAPEPRPSECTGLDAPSVLSRHLDATGEPADGPAAREEAERRSPAGTGPAAPAARGPGAGGDPGCARVRAVLGVWRI
ncbi:hypothetical protein [Streptomyces sp. NPDC093109]|uniref:hypothetical protein n=1 Tax=Streptomyces sp. NPDC093109 TaxID=3154977 RepID=UPI00344CE12B